MGEKAEVSISKITGVTKFNTFKISYEWKIYNLKTSGIKTGEKIVSALFGPIENHDIKWNLDLYPNGFKKDYADCISVFLNFHKSESVTNIETNYSFSIRDKLGQIQHKKEIIYHFNETDHNYGYMSYIKRNILFENDNLVPDDCLTLICDIVGSTNYITLPNSYDDFINSKIHNSFLEKLQSGYETMFNNPKLSDVIFKVSNKKLYAHKSILAAHSPVFLAMFDNDMKEKHCGTVDINDVEFDAFQEMLRFIYCGKTDKMSTYVNDLLILADKYAIEVMKDECEKHLGLNLNIENVVDTLNIADLYHASDLKNYAIDFLIKHKNKFVEKETFKSIKKLQPEIMEEIIRKLMLQ